MATPVIILPAPGQSMLDVMDGDQIVRSAWPISADPQKIMKPLLGPMMKVAMFRKDSGFSDAVAKTLGKLVDDLTILKNGETKYPIHVCRQENPYADFTDDQKASAERLVGAGEIASVIGEENCYLFAYHFFGSAYQTARELDQYIGHVLEKTGEKKVNLLVFSLAGAIAESYLDLYAEKAEVHRVVCADADMLGTHMISDILSENLNLSNLESLFQNLGGDIAETFSGVTEMIPESILQTAVCKLTAELADRLLVNSSLMWGAVPPEEYPKLKERYLLDPERAAVLAEAEKLYAIHADLSAFVARVEASGVRFFNLCGCGRRLFPIFGSGEIASDGLVDAASSSMGAFCAPTGGMFEEGFSPANADIPNAISPDFDVDASAGAVPERTWFFDGTLHQEFLYNDVAVKLILRILSDENFNSVDSDAAFPRFNGSRNIKRLKKELCPRFAAVDRSAFDEETQAEYDELAEKLQDFLNKTIIEDDSETEDMEDLLSDFLAIE